VRYTGLLALKRRSLFVSVKEHGQRVVILALVVAFVLSSVSFSGLVIWQLVKDKNKNNSTADIQKQLQDQLNQQQNNQGGSVESTDITPGTGAEAVSGKKVTVNYTGTLKSDGSKFDSSYDRNQPFSFTLGNGEVIKGWDQGVVGMKVGGKRKLVIPAALAYGASSPSDKIPPNSDLVFEVELLNVE
jgi:FKBP-type peptidyl-prolyl cis-trans isomerase FkpA